MNKLNAKSVKAAKAKGKYPDGGGLYLQIRPPNGRSWILRVKIHNKERYIGLGPVDLVTLADAREEAIRLRQVIRAGGDPLAERRAEVVTFAHAAQSAYEASLPSRKSKKAKDWISSLENHVHPSIGDRPIGTLTSQDVVAVLNPIWHKVPETARRIKQRMSVVFDWAKTAGFYPHENPVNSIKPASLGHQADKVKNFASMPWSDVPAFMIAIAQRDAITARALAFGILCASRAGEVRGARWSEIDLDVQVWTIPAPRMKGRKGKEHEHRVPLSDQAIAVLEAVRGLDDELVFPAVKGGELSDAAVRALLKRMDHGDITQHGFRSSFRTWVQDNTGVPHEVAERCLAHAVGNKVSQAYARSDMLNERRKVMQSWADYALDVGSDKVVVLATARAKAQ